MKELILFLIVFIIVYLVYFLFVINRKKSLEKWKKGKEMTYLTKVYKLNLKKIKINKIAHVIALSNAFIVALTVSIVMLFKNFIVQMLLGFIILCLLILLTYHIIGKLYQKKYRKK